MKLNSKIALEKLLQAQPDGLAGLIISGSDQGYVRALIERAADLLKQSWQDIETVRLQAAQLLSNPNRLYEESAYRSLFSVKKMIFITGADERLSAQLLAYFSAASVHDFLFVEMAILKKSSRLRHELESHKAAALLTVYDNKREDYEASLEVQLSQYKMSIEPAAKQILIAQLASDFAHFTQEIEKLITYCWESKHISKNDIDALEVLPSSGPLDQILEAAFSGDFALTDRLFQNLVASGVVASRFLSLCMNYIARLQALNLRLQEGASLENVLNSAKPPIFFKQQAMVGAHLRRWSADNLIKAAQFINMIALKTRLHPSLDLVLVNRALLTLTKIITAKS